MSRSQAIINIHGYLPAKPPPKMVGEDKCIFSIRFTGKKTPDWQGFTCIIHGKARALYAYKMLKPRQYVNIIGWLEYYTKHKKHVVEIINIMPFNESSQSRPDELVPREKYVPEPLPDNKPKFKRKPKPPQPLML